MQGILPLSFIGTRTASALAARKIAVQAGYKGKESFVLP